MEDVIEIIKCKDVREFRFDLAVGDGDPSEYFK